MSEKIEITAEEYEKLKAFENESGEELYSSALEIQKDIVRCCRSDEQ